MVYIFPYFIYSPGLGLSMVDTVCSLSSVFFSLYFKQITYFYSFLMSLINMKAKKELTELPNGFSTFCAMFFSSFYFS